MPYTELEMPVFPVIKRGRGPKLY